MNRLRRRKPLLMQAEVDDFRPRKTRDHIQDTICNICTGLFKYEILSWPSQSTWINNTTLQTWVDVHVAHWLGIRTDSFYLFNDLFADNVRTSVYQKSYGTSACICSPYATDTGSQGELDLCRYLHTGIGPAIVQDSHPKTSAVCCTVALMLYKSSVDVTRGHHLRLKT